MAVVTAAGARSCTSTGRRCNEGARTSPGIPISAAKGEYKHFMQKEIYEQAAVADRHHPRAAWTSPRARCFSDVEPQPDEAHATDQDDHRRLRHGAITRGWWAST